VAKTAASAVELAVRGLRNGSFVVVVCASPTGERTSAHTRAAVAAVAAHETLVEATRVAQVAGEDKHHRAAALLLASSGDDADAARSAAREAMVAGTVVGGESRDAESISSDANQNPSPNTRFEFASVQTPATCEEMHVGLCHALRGGVEYVSKVVTAQVRPWGFPKSDTRCFISQLVTICPYIAQIPD
tara:strand:+ start:7041 stop:7607 length:567 start_codon:yes stop_codon:yes gene_type:complete